MIGIGLSARTKIITLQDRRKFRDRAITSPDAQPRSSIVGGACAFDGAVDVSGWNR
jgi:hypothetical protein